MIAWIAIAASSLAAVPAILFLRNLALYTPAPSAHGQAQARCSVLIPARNEEANIAGAILSVLRTQNADFEVIVLDDGSTDRTAQIVRAISSKTGGFVLRQLLHYPRAGAVNRMPATFLRTWRAIRCWSSQTPTFA